MRGIKADGSPLHLKREYIRNGIRSIAEDLCTAHVTRVFRHGAHFSNAGLRLLLRSPVSLRHFGDGVAAEFSLTEGKSRSFQLCQLDEGGHSGDTGPSEQEYDRLFNDTVEYWRKWLSKSTCKGRWQEIINRSALALQLLTYEPTGAIVAAPTCSLPESLGGARNWDYRFTWIRDAAFTVYSLMRIGYTEEAMQFAGFLDARCRGLRQGGSLQTVYGIDGRRKLKEETLDHLDGYMGSRPVRTVPATPVGYFRRVDGYSLYLYNKYGKPSLMSCGQISGVLPIGSAPNWRKKDDAIWEVRGGRRDFVYSKVMYWVAVDRALRLATKRSLPADWRRWMHARDQMYQTIMKHGWSENRRPFRAELRPQCSGRIAPPDAARILHLPARPEDGADHRCDQQVPAARRSGV